MCLWTSKLFSNASATTTACLILVHQNSVLDGLLIKPIFDFSCLLFVILVCQNSALPFSCFQVIKAFRDPKFFNIIFPLLFEMSGSTALNKSGHVPLPSDASKEGCYMTYFSSKTFEFSFFNTASILVDVSMSCVWGREHRWR